MGFQVLIWNILAFEERLQSPLMWDWLPSGNGGAWCEELHRLCASCCPLVPRGPMVGVKPRHRLLMLLDLVLLVLKLIPKVLFVPREALGFVSERDYCIACESGRVSVPWYRVLQRLAAVQEFGSRKQEMLLWLYFARKP